MIVSTLWVGLSGSKSTRLLRHGMAGHIVEMVGLSWMAKPWGRSSRRRQVSTPPDLGVSATTGETARAEHEAMAASPIHRAIFMPVAYPGQANALCCRV